MDEEVNAGVAAKEEVIEIDLNYEFSAPMYFDFSYEETEVDVMAAERWFESAAPSEDSPHVAKTKSMAELCSAASDWNNDGDKEAQQILAHVSPKLQKKPTDVQKEADGEGVVCEEIVVKRAPCTPAPQGEPCTPAGPRMPSRGLGNLTRTPRSALIASPGRRLGKRIYSNEVTVSARPVQGSKTMPRNSRLSISRRTFLRNTSTRKEKPAARKVNALSPYDVQARKKQKLDSGRLRQVDNMKESVVKPIAPPTMTAHRLGKDTRSRVNLVDKTPHTTSKLQRSQSVQVERAASPYISMAEKVQRFQLKTPERFHVVPSWRTGNSSQDGVPHTEKPKMKLTRPKEPEFETSHRARPPRMKSTADMEEEMLAKLPKFKARPLPKKILEALPKTIKPMPQLPEFQMSEMKDRRKSAPVGPLTEPRPPRLQTANRSRPPTVKSSEEREVEELAKIPKFKARPLNKRIFRSRGDLGLFRNQKRQVTMPQEFRFKTGERAQLRGPQPLTEQLNKLSLNQQFHQEAPPRPRNPEPFHLATDDRGLAKKMKMLRELIEKEQQEAAARIPKANPLPYTTDYPAIPPKPEPKECTKPEPFRLESLVRHEEELQRQALERSQAEELDAAMKEFHAQPNLSNVPVFLPTRSRKQLTEIQEFSFHVDHRAMERAEFDRKVTEKQMQYQQFREEYEAFRKAEEERFIKAMRREMVPMARPMPEFNRPFMPQRSGKELTKAVSPHFHVQFREDRQRSLTASAKKRIQMR